MSSGQLDVRLLGRFAVHRDGAEVPLGAFGGRLARRLVRYLVCRDGDLVPHDVIIEALWGDAPPTDPTANLKVIVSRARRVVGDAIQTGPGGYRLDPDACEVDATAFLDAVAEATALLRDGAVADARTGFRDALALWTGDPLPEDLYEPWAAAPRRRLLAAHVAALEGGAAAALAMDDPVPAIDLAGRVCDREPLRDHSHVLLVRALVDHGDRPRALEVVRGLVDRTRSELGLDPSPAVAELQAELLAGEPPPRAPVRPARPPTADPAQLPLVDRGTHLATILDAVRRTPPDAVLLRGPSGSGKSRLLDEVATRLDLALLVGAHAAERHRDGSLLRDVVRAAAIACPEGVGALHPRLRTALGSLVPELADDATPPDVDARSLRSLQTEAAVVLLGAAARRGAVLLVDDLQWVDPTSAEVLGVVTARTPDLRVVVGTRPRGMRGDAPVDRMLQRLRSSSAMPVEVDLPPLTETGLAAVAAAPLPRILAAGTDGSAFAVASVVAELRAADLVEVRPDGRLAPRADATTAELTTATRVGHERSLRARITRRPGPQREVLDLLALLGRTSSAGLLADATERPVDAVLDDLDDLTRSGLVAGTPRGWRLAHDRTADLVVRELDAVRRRRCHARLAAALDRTHGDPGELAVHLEGAGTPSEAAGAHARAAADRLGRAATDEAARHARAGLALDPDRPLRRELLRLDAEASAARGELGRARDDLRTALRDADDGPERAHLLTRLAMLSLGADDLHHAEELAERAILEAGEDPAACARALAVASVVDMNRDRSERSRERADRALRLYRSLGDAAGVASILDARAMAAFLDGDVGGAIAAFDRVADAFEDAGQLLQVVTPRSTRGHALVFAARPEAGLRDIEAAGALADVLGQAEGQAYTDWHRSEALTALGRVDDALRAARRAIATATAIDHRGWTVTGHLALGAACAAGGDPDGAQQAWRTAMEDGSTLPLFHTWAAARLARLHVAGGHLDEAGALVARALEQAPALGAYEARLAEVELLAARGDAGTPAALRRARTLARGGGHEASAQVLDRIAEDLGVDERPDRDQLTRPACPEWRGSRT